MDTAVTPVDLADDKSLAAAARLAN
jgi:hypothetical protein